MEPRGPECTRRGGARRPRPSVHSWPSRWAFDDRWRVELTNSPSTAKNLLAIPVARVRAALTRGQVGAAAARIALRRPPQGRPPAAPRGQAAFRCRNAQEAPSFGAAPAAKAERPRGNARAPGPAEGPETTRAPLLGPRPEQAARDSSTRRPTAPHHREPKPCRAPWASPQIP